MISVSEHIEYLLHKHDCVVVPGWGAFIAQYQSAKIDTIKGTITPPSRTIGFNASINHNDGLLATSIMRHKSTSYDIAVNIMETEINAMRYQLDNDGELAIGHIGIFRKAKDNPMTFEPYTSKSLKYAGLPTVKLIEHNETNDTNYKKAEKKDVVLIPISRNIFKVAASIILLIGLGITLSTPIIVDKNATNFASISTPKVTIKSQLAEPNINSELLIAIPTDKDALAIADTTARESVRPINPDRLHLNDNDKYCLVIASLATREIAEEYIKESGNNDLRILESNGKYRVYIATGSTVAQALQPTHSSAFSERYPTAWVCRR